MKSGLEAVATGPLVSVFFILTSLKRGDTSVETLKAVLTASAGKPLKRLESHAKLVVILRKRGVNEILIFIAITS